MSDLEDLCGTLGEINGEILRVSQQLHAEAQALNRGAATAAHAARSAEGNSTAALARAADAFAVAAKHCGKAATGLAGASRDAQAFVLRTVGSSTSSRSRRTAADDTKEPEPLTLKEKTIGFATCLYAIGRALVSTEPGRMGLAESFDRGVKFLGGPEGGAEGYKAMIDSADDFINAGGATWIKEEANECRRKLCKFTRI